MTNMTHIEQLKSEKEALLKKREDFNREAFDIKVKIRFNDKRIKFIEDELQELTSNDTLIKTE